MKKDLSVVVFMRQTLHSDRIVQTKLLDKGALVDYRSTSHLPSHRLGRPLQWQCHLGWNPPSVRFWSRPRSCRGSSHRQERCYRLSCPKRFHHVKPWDNRNDSQTGDMGIFWASEIIGQLWLLDSVTHQAHPLSSSIKMSSTSTPGGDQPITMSQ